MNKITVLGFIENNGQIVMAHVTADDLQAAFLAAARKHPEATFVASLPGHLHESEGGKVEHGGIGFPGEGVVDAETILEQDDVFS